MPDHGRGPSESNFDQFDSFWISDAPLWVLAEEPGIKRRLETGIAAYCGVITFPVDDGRLVVSAEEHQVDLPGNVCAVIGKRNRELREIFGPTLEVFE